MKGHSQFYNDAWFIGVLVVDVDMYYYCPLCFETRPADIDTPVHSKCGNGHSMLLLDGDLLPFDPLGSDYVAESTGQTYKHGEVFTVARARKQAQRQRRERDSGIRARSCGVTRYGRGTRYGRKIIPGVLGTRNRSAWYLELLSRGSKMAESCCDKAG